MIDIHSHILPGLDDGPPTVEDSIALARAAVAAGTEVMVATPHVREDHAFPLEAIATGVAELNAALSAAAVPLEVLAGAEVAITKIPDFDDETLEGLCLGSGDYVLVESPYSYTTGLLDKAVFDLQARGLRPILAHPERCPSFLQDPRCLAVLVERGVLCSVTALSMSGGFGRAPQAFCRRMFEEELVHNVASDCHDVQRRPPGLARGFEAAGSPAWELERHVRWFTEGSPGAILAGEELPTRPERPARRSRRGLRGFFTGRGRRAQGYAWSG
jgi:protein-tyrosine phosphatase